MSKALICIFLSIIGYLSVMKAHVLSLVLDQCFSTEVILTPGDIAQGNGKIPGDVFDGHSQSAVVGVVGTGIYNVEAGDAAAAVCAQLCLIATPWNKHPAKHRTTPTTKKSQKCEGEKVWARL